jgi:Disulphide bond corrector protein DsbC
MLKLIHTIIATLLVSFMANAQMATPVNWTFAAKKISDTEFQVTLTANIEEGWYVYSQEMPKKGPVPTKIDFEKNPNIILDGKPIEVGQKKEGFDANFNMNVIKLEGKTNFVQKVKIVGDASAIRGNLEFMTCNGEMCMPPTKVNFNVPLN